MGSGMVNILRLGGIVPPKADEPRLEYVMAGAPIEQIGAALGIAKEGETVVSRDAWAFVKDCVKEGRRVQGRSDIHLLAGMDDNNYTFPTIKHAAIENDHRTEKQFRLSELRLIKKYMASAVFKQIEYGTMEYLNEMRQVSMIFVVAPKLDVLSEEGANTAQKLMTRVQKATNQHEGLLNKVLIDDKGMRFLIVFGLPPLVHTDDPTRAVLLCFDLVEVFKQTSANLVGKFGVTSGRSYCGMCGSAQRMEYTVLGDCVNLAAKLSLKAADMAILCDEETKNHTTTELIFNALAPMPRTDNAGNAKAGDPIPNFQPIKKIQKKDIGLCASKVIRFPWHDAPFAGGQSSSSSAAGNVEMKKTSDLCSIKTWEGIGKVQDMLGGAFQKSLHASEQQIDLKLPMSEPPPDSPFTTGGIVLIEGPTGMGKIELAEHLVISGATRFRALPVFGNMTERPGDGKKMASELIVSILNAFRALGDVTEKDDIQALHRVLPQHSLLPSLEQALNMEVADAFAGVQGIIALLKELVVKSAITMVMRLEFGTSLCPQESEDMRIFWKTISAFYDGLKDVMGAGSSKPMVMVILCADSREMSDKVKNAIRPNHRLILQELSPENILQYMANYLNVQETMIPQPLREFVTNVSQGNPEYIRETLENLLEKHIQINWGANKQPRALELKDFQPYTNIDIASWQHTKMVGSTVCMLESLDPLEAAVLKMSTCFAGENGFTLPDLAANTCPKWSGTTQFDNLRLYKAIERLKQKYILDSVTVEEGEAGDVMSHHMQAAAFKMNKLLIRAVGSSMILENQRKAVKRQALMNRAIAKNLPGRMREINSRRGAGHIPWYYEQAFRRMDKTPLS